MGIQGEPAVKAALKGVPSGVMKHHLWMLMTWAVIDMASVIKF